MTLGSPQEPTDTGKPARAWVWRSTDASIAAGQISVVAVAEVFLAVGLYWWLSRHFEWPWFSMIGLVAAPMLLLRSDKSVVLGVEMLRTWHDRAEKDIGQKEKVMTVLLSCLITVVLIYLFAQAWLPGNIGWDLYFFRGIALLLTAWVLAFAFLGIFRGAPVVQFTREGVGAVACVFRAGFVLGVIGLALGTFVRACYIRLIATLRHPIFGLRTLPRNWSETLLIVDLFHSPELLPRAGSVNEMFSLRGLWQLTDQNYLSNRVLTVILSIAWYLPAIAYRWSLKASAWLWWPLAIALTPPLQGLDGPARREKAAHLTGGAWAFPILLPLAVLAWLALSAWPGFAAWLALLPETGRIANTLLSLLTPPPPGLRYVLLWLAPVLALALWWRRKNFQAAWSQVLASDKEYRELTPEEQQRFDAGARAVERLRLLLIVALLFLGEAIALAFAHGKDPQGVERLIWPGLLNWL